MASTSIPHVLLAVAGLLALATVLSIFARRVGLPFTAVLVIVGLGIGEAARHWAPLSGITQLQLSPALLTYVFLPTLLFEATFSIDTRLLMRNIVPSLALAIPAVIVSFLVTGAAAYWTLPLSLGGAFLFAALISATDSTAALDVFVETGAPKRLDILAQGENLFNDATSVVLFGLVLALLGIGGGLPSTGGLPVVGGNLATDVIGSFLLSFVGGLLAGGAIGLAFGKLIEEFDDDLIEILLTVSVAYISFITGELFLRTGGIMAVVGTALVLGGWGRTKYSVATLEHLERFWKYLSFAAHALIFLMVGFMIDVGVMREQWVAVLIGIGIAIAGRAISIYGLFPFVNRLPWVERADFAHQTAMVWGGLRGAMSLVLAMSIPATFAGRDTILTMTLAVVLFSLLVQGLTLRPLVWFLGLDRPSASERYLLEEGLLTAKRRARERISEMNDGGVFSNEVVEKLDSAYAREEDVIQWELKSLREQSGMDAWDEFRLLKREQLLLEKRVYQDLFTRGQIAESVYKELQHSVALQIDRLRTQDQLPAWTIRSPFGMRTEALIFRLLDAVLPDSDWVNRYRMRRIAERYETHWSRVIATQRVLAEMPRLAGQYPNNAALVDELRSLYEGWHENARGRLDAVAQHFPEYASKVQELMALRLCLQAEEEAIDDLERLEVLPEREARAVRGQLRDQLRRIRERPLEALEPKPEELLAKVPMFRQLPRDEFERIVPVLRQRTFLADETIVREGDIGTSLFLICRGMVRVTLGREGIAEVPVATLIAGDYFGEMAALTANPRTATVRAITDTMAYVLEAADLRRVADVCPTLEAELEATYRRRREELDAKV